MKIEADKYPSPFKVSVVKKIFTTSHWRLGNGVARVYILQFLQIALLVSILLWLVFFD